MTYPLVPPRRFLAACAGVVVLLAALMPPRAGADPAPTAIAVFDFELDDFSAAAGVAGDPSADAEQLRKATDEARALLAGSGRYVLVDVTGAAGEPAKGHRLRQCDGCEAAVARDLGAAQSLLGVVTRISRTEYVLRLVIRDARSGEPLVARQSDLRIGANYSWPRGAASLVRNAVLTNP